MGPRACQHLVVSRPGPNALFVRGHKPFRAGAWRLTVNAKDPVSGKRKPVYATVHAPNNRRGEAKADSELAKLVALV